MEEVRQLVQEEGREARNLVAFHVAVDTPARVSRKPPRALPPARRAPPRATRLRSASAGRDKRSELRARYWALLFGDLQRAVGEIYNTVEAHENLNECQEVILVLENYTRDFKALGEWFRLKWEYDNTPPPQRPQSLAWEIRKTDFVRPESRRTFSVKTSPSVSGKNSPCLSGYNTPSGKNSPNLTGKASPGSGKISPRISSNSSPKATVEFFSNKIVASKITAKPEPKVAKETSRLSDIKEKDVTLENSKEINDDIKIENKISNNKEEQIKAITVEIGTAKEYQNACPKQVVVKSPKHVKTKITNNKKSADDISCQAKTTITQLDAMENEFLYKQLTENEVRNNNIINKDIEKENIINSKISDIVNINDKIEKIKGEKDDLLTKSPTKSEDNFADISNESSPKFNIEKPQDKNVDINKVPLKANENSVHDYRNLNGNAGELLTSDAIGSDIEKTQSDPVINESENEKLKPDVHIGIISQNLSPLVAEKVDVCIEDDNGKETRTEEIQEKSKPVKIVNSINCPVIKDTPKNVKLSGEKKFDETIGEINEPTRNVTVDNVHKKNQIFTTPIEMQNQPPETVINTCDSLKKLADYDSKDLMQEKTLNMSSEAEKEKKTTTNCKEFTKEAIAIEKDDSKKDQDLKKFDIKSNLEAKPTAKPAYSQAAAKPKTSTQPTKVEVKTPTRLARSSTVVEIRPTTVPKTPRSFQKKNQTNKCSYPFNLTTGRSSLFDGTSNTNNKGVIPKRTINRISQNMSSADPKTVTNKEVIKKRPPRPNSLKINEKTDKKEKSSALEKNKDSKDFSSSDTVVPQGDIMSRIESSESIKTLVPEDHHVLQDVANSIEVLNVDSNKNDNEGWLTVKSRRLSRESKKHLKSHWSNRFHQPSATTSLPTLNMLESPKQETKSIVVSKENKIDRAKSEQPQQIEKQLQKVEKIKPEKLVPYEMLVNNETVITSENLVSNSSLDTNEKLPRNEKPASSNIFEGTPKSEKLVKISPKPKSDNKLRDASMIRQKSDVTGLRTKSSRNKVLTKRAEKVKDCQKCDDTSELTKNRLHSSLESLTTALARSQESTADAFDFDKWKAEFKSTFKYLEDDDQMPDQNEILKAADPSEMSEIAEMTSQIEENERIISWALDFQSEVDQRKLCEEEDLLNRQILELQQVSDIEIDTETDDTETDAEILCEDPPAQVCPTETLGALAASLEDQYETALAGMSWAERVDTLVVLEALVARDPGRAQQLHAKLSQGIKRRGSLQDALRRLQAKQARAERQRLEYQTERAKKIHQLLARVEEVKVAKNQLIEEKRMRMERRLQKAAENRDQHLKDIVRKAHDEEEKLREIAFIKQLEAENRRHEFLEQCRTHTTRLRQMRRDRLHKLEQKAAREAAVGARRQALEVARQQHVASLLERRKERDARVEELKELKKQERDDAARERAEGVKSRLSALAAAAELEADALRSRIRDKQDASQQRLESHLQAIREKATGPRQATTSESQDQNSKEEEEETLRLDQERKEREKQKMINKKARKLKQKLLLAGNTNPIFDDNITTLDTFLNQATSKVYRAISSIRHIIAPLVVETKIADGIEDETECSTNGTSKKRKKTKPMNGDVKNEPDKENVTKKRETNTNTDFRIEPSSSKECVEEVPKQPDEKVLEVSKESKKKRKKKKNGEDKLTLNIAGSVCSSMSDMSRTSGKSERKAKVDLDLPFLEKQMNELYRLMERHEKNNRTEKAAVQRFQAVKVISQLLAVAAEKEDLNPPISAKCLTTAVTLVTRVMTSCTATAAQVLSTNTCVHQATLLAKQMEKDLQSDAREMELAKQLTDCISVALDSVLCATRLHEDNGTRPKEESEILGELRNRAHQLISYLCLSGVVTNAENAGEVRETIQTLLTVCADLCHPYQADFGSEREHARQALKTALGKSVCGSRAEFCMLFAKGASLGQCGDFVKAARTSHLLKAIAEMDHHIVQEAFGEDGWPLEFRAAVARLLSQHAPNEKEAPRTSALGLSNQRLDQTLSETMVLDLIILVGFVVVNNPQLQDTICEGWSVIKTLCTLPANWFVSEARCNALLPTLITLADRPQSAAAIASEMSMSILEEFLENPGYQKIKLIKVIKQGRAKKNSAKK
ncbi:S phase cyclin A-associated protein in the endoplasmic reticulum [Maniola jurtina]|uniref:S phase cyclin A-associated protein in the endoplasmic reticulum n=1 Tax=Maniola jurtina TaxID=191418 RepID=UPI001E688177|nr:S phase cyclin A-associated protein in the endoplasmic reticulum [Maniola jurtina]